MKIKTLKRFALAHQGTNLRHQLIRGALGVGGLKVLSLSLTLVASILLARGLGPEGYGQFAFIMAMVTFLSLPVGPGVAQLVTREVARYHHDSSWGLFRGLLRRAHQWTMIGSISIITIIVFIVFINSNPTPTGRWALLAIGILMIPLMGLNAVRTGTLRGLRYTFHAQIPEFFVRPATHLFLVCLLLMLDALTPTSALSTQIVGMALAFIVGAVILHRYQPTCLKHTEPTYDHREWGRALLPFTLLTAVSTMNSQIGIIIIGWLGTDEETAILQIAQRGSMLVMLSLTIINPVIAPYITRAHQDRDHEKLQKLSRKSARAALFISLPIALPLIFLGEPIVRIIYGEVYSELTVWPLAILSFGQLFNVAFGSVGIFLTMTGFERHTLEGQSLALAFNMLVAFALIPKFGAIGAATAGTVGLMVWNTVLAIRFFQHLRLRPSAF
ncbi:oligosaccharide flippase family protein [Halomonadaceae bacterium KBTZ08]